VAIGAATCALLCACGGEQVPGGGPQPCPDVIYDGEIPVPATSTVMMMNTRVTAQASNPSGEVQVSITDNKGTVAFGGRDPVSVFTYKRIPWPDVGLTLFAGMGASDGAWSLFWVYCDAAGKLTQFYAERTDSPATTNE
jgi:hypothetical protein